MANILLELYVVCLGITESEVSDMAQKLKLMKGSSESLLLCLISQQPMYGYQIIKEIERKSQGYFKFKEGTLYPALHRLEKAGLILSKWQMLPSGRQRRYYYITDKGYRLLAVKRSQWLDFLTAMNLIIQPASA
jgi:DNA-binding PadR family transcriptional regulator